MDSSSIHEEALRHLRMLDRAGFVALPAVSDVAGESQFPAEAPEAVGPPDRTDRTDQPDTRLISPIAFTDSAESPDEDNLTEDMFGEDRPKAKPRAIAPRDAPELSPPEKAAALAEVAAEIAQCRKCRLCHGRTNTVPGEGNPGAKLVFIGEGPGEQEDRQGRPFVGPSGDFLNKMIGAMHFQREDVFIGNVVKCRPPGNRDPEADEVAACRDYLTRQLDIIRPKLIVTLGRPAAQCLLSTTAPIGKLRGKWTQYRGIPVMPTFHPAYLLRSPSEKRKCWEDLQQAMAEYEKRVGPLPRGRQGSGGARG